MNKIELIKTHYLDASAMVKLVSKEKGRAELLDLLHKPHKPQFFKTTIICIAEALGKLKKDYLKKRLDLKQYLDTVYEFLAYFREETIQIDKTALHNREVFSEVEEIVKKYNKIDISDALQIYILKNEPKSLVRTEIILVTADKNLAEAARQERLKVWDCKRERYPENNSINN
jgi:predicted nucleic acid-binding protein